MKYPKVLQVLLVASVFTAAVPGAAMPSYASVVESGDALGDEEQKETPEEYEERTEYVLPEGYHYVLEDEKYVTFDEDGEVIIEKDEELTDGEEAVTDGKEAEGNTDPDAGETAGDAKDGESQEAGETDEDGEDGADQDTDGTEGDENGEGGVAGDGEDKEDNEDKEDSAGKEDGADDKEDDNNSGNEDSDSKEDGVGGDKTDDENTGDNNGNSVIDGPGINGGSSTNAPDSDKTEENDAVTGNNGVGGTNAGVVIGNKKEIGIKSEAGGKGKKSSDKKKKRAAKEAKKKAYKKTTGAKPATEKSGADKTASELVKDAIKKQTEADADFETSAKFLKLGERIRYNVEVPIEGLPSFITQEMIISALKAQDETGYPASVTIAQIIQESGYGQYGPGGKDGEGLSYLAYQYCNLFGIKGKGTIGSALMNTFEMTSGGQSYATKAGFRAYNTYTECIEDRCKLLDEVYSDLTENVTDANTFAVRVGSRWATDVNYSRSLIKTMEKYDLYRLDEMTLTDFDKLIGRFADPCPGATVSSTYGYRTFDHSFHKGLDLGTGTENIPTYAADAGTVIFAGDAGTAGNMVVIDHGDGLVTKYMHHFEVFVEEGQEVEKGQQIGLSGTTGYSTGNHLHFQVEENGKAVDPMKYLSDEGSGEIVKMRDKSDVSQTFVKADSSASDILSGKKLQMSMSEIRERIQERLIVSR